MLQTYSFETERILILSGDLFNVIRTPSIFIAMLCIAICTVSQGFYSATLEPHLREVQYTFLKNNIIVK